MSKQIIAQGVVFIPENNIYVGSLNITDVLAKKEDEFVRIIISTETERPEVKNKTCGSCGWCKKLSEGADDYGKCMRGGNSKGGTRIINKYDAAPNCWEEPKYK